MKIKNVLPICIFLTGCATSNDSALTQEIEKQFLASQGHDYSFSRTVEVYPTTGEDYSPNNAESASNTLSLGYTPSQYAIFKRSSGCSYIYLVYEKCPDQGSCTYKFERESSLCD
jgi:hypothetical protein